MFSSNRSVADVLKQFNKVVNDLNSIIEREKGRQADLQSQQDRLREHKLASIEEQNAAERVAKKLSELIK